MKSKVLASLLLLALCVFPAAGDGMRIQVENFSLDVPLGWLAQYTKSPSVFMLYSPPEENDAFRENCNLVVEALPASIGLEGYMRLSRDALGRVYRGLRVVESGGNFHIITGSMNGIALMQLQYFYIDGRTAYVLTFTSIPPDFDRYRAEFAGMAESFRY
jgi:hypothetical protein